MKLNGIEIDHLPVTLRNQQICKDWYQRISNHIQQRSVEYMLRTIARLRHGSEELAELIDEVGMVNNVTLQARIVALIEAHKAQHDYENEQRKAAKQAELEYEPMTAEAAKAIAEQELKDSLVVLLKDSPEIGRQMYFNLDAFPQTMESMLMGIDCIRATVDYSKLSENESHAIKSANDSEFWQDVTASEVAQYVNRFRSSHKQ